MKWTVLTAILATMSATAAAAGKDRARDEAAIRAYEQACDTAWNKGDAAAFAALFTADALVVNPFGAVARGREEIRALAAEMLAGPAKGSIHKGTVVRVRFLDDRTALVDGEVTMEGMKGPDGKPAPLFRATATEVLVKAGGAWLASDLRSYVLLPSHPAPPTTARK